MKRVLLVALLVLLAGCSSLPGTSTGTGERTTVDDEPTGTVDPEPAETSATPTAERPATSTATPTSTSTPTPTETTPTSETPTEMPVVEPADNPWGKDTVTVALVQGDHEETDYSTALAGTIDYWNSNTQYGAYDVEFVAIDDVDEADLRVKIRESVDSCGVEHGDRVLGCAPLLTDGTRADAPVPVKIEAGYNQASTEEIMIHEFGHVLGIRHGEDPERYMQPRDTANTTAKPNASERAYPWRTTEFTFYAATDDLPQSDRDDAREQIRRAIDYYSRIKDEDPAVPDNVTLELTDTRSEANVVVRFADQLPTGDTQGSTLSQFGFDPDGDRAMEYYSNASIVIADLDTDAVGWHTGYWYGQALGLEVGELPAPFQDATARERRSDWWTESP